MIRAHYKSKQPEHNKLYAHASPSEEAQICLNCTSKKCNGDCERLKRERKKLKGKTMNDND